MKGKAQLGNIPVVECLPHRHKAIGLIASTTKIKIQFTTKTPCVVKMAQQQVTWTLSSDPLTPAHVLWHVQVCTQMGHLETSRMTHTCNPSFRSEGQYG